MTCDFRIAPAVDSCRSAGAAERAALKLHRILGEVWGYDAQPKAKGDAGQRQRVALKAVLNNLEVARTRFAASDMQSSQDIRNESRNY